jgi:hypothetical protein
MGIDGMGMTGRKSRTYVSVTGGELKVALFPFADVFLVPLRVTSEAVQGPEDPIARVGHREDFVL